MESATSTPPDRKTLEALLPRYDMAGPRYTSYPTAPSWQEELTADEYRRVLGSLTEAESSPYAVYVHVPFCRKLCHFCACNRVVTQKPELPVQYLQTLGTELQEVRSALPGSGKAGQFHLGGGTPTHLSPNQLEELMSAVFASFPPSETPEISIEIDPRVTLDAHMDVLEATGFNRISMGIQDFDPRVQEAIHRKQTVSEVAHLVERARMGGNCGINFDLIYGLPHQTEQSFSRTLQQVIDLAPDRIALYGYAHVTWVAKQQRGFERIDLPSPLARLSLLILAIESLTRAGYISIGMDHFALPDDDLARAIPESRLHRNFMGYTTSPCGELLAFGPSGISELSSGFVQSQRNLKDWQESVADQGLAPFRGHHSSPEDKRRAWVISQIMCQGELRASAFSARFGREFLSHFSSELEHLKAFEADGLLDLEADGSFRMTPAGRILVRNAAMLFDAYLPKQKNQGGRLFSRTV